MEHNGKWYVTDQYVVGGMGKDKRVLPFTNMSNDRITEKELNYFRVVQGNYNMRMPTRSEVVKKAQRMMSLRHITWTDELITQKLAKQEQYASDAVAAVQAARRPDFLKTDSQKTALRLEERNKKNRELNRKEGREALIRERREREARSRAAHELRLKREQEAAEKAKKEEERKLRMAAKLEAKKNGELFGDEAELSTPGISRTGTPIPERYQMKKLPTFTRPKRDDEVIGAIDVQLDIDI
jgi:hypothetical protein